MILGVESSCDESSLALFSPERGLAGEWTHSQIERHRPHGGVVPEIASREHLKAFPALLERAHEALGADRPDRIAVTCGPGLAGCLALGVSLAKSLALLWGAELVGANHLRGHAFSPFIGLHADAPNDFESRFSGLLPHLGLIVSGGNTLLFSIDRERRLTVLARTVDDAAGEALDKGAKLLGMPYPGGPLIEKTAVGGDAAAFDFPRAFAQSGELRFSFSGLKTSLRYLLEKLGDAELEASMPNICASYQEAVVDALALKTRQAARRLGPFASLGLSGGVANNGRLRAAFADLAKAEGLPFFVAEPRHTGDNAGMIAFAAWADPGGLVSGGLGELSFCPSLRLDQADS